MKIFAAGRTFIGLSWAKSLLWHDITKRDDKLTALIAIQVVEHRSGLKALRLIFGPVSMMIGRVSRG